MLLSPSSRHRLLPVALLSVFLTAVTPTQTLIPASPEGCPYIAENCTRLELLPVQRTDSCHQNIATGFAQEIAAADDAQGVDLVFYGDSITKQWREVQPQVNGTPEVFTTYFGQYAAAILGVGEDQTSNLLWRLQHGEVFLKHPPQVIIVLIGTNDLGAAASCNVGEPGATTAANGTASRSLHTPTHNTWQAAEQSVTSTAVTADDECCAGTLKYFGSNSTMTSRNCFCVPSVYERFTAGLVDVAVAEYFGVCTLRGFPIPVYEAGTGACSGAPYNTSALFSTVLFDPEHLAPQKTLHQWLKDLHKDSLILTSFIFGLIAAIGFGGGIWIFCYNLVRSLTMRKHK